MGRVQEMGYRGELARGSEIGVKGRGKEGGG